VRLAQVTAAAASGSAQGSVGGAGTAEDLLQLMRLLAAQDMAGGRDRSVCNARFCNAFCCAFVQRSRTGVATVCTAALGLCSSQYCRSALYANTASTCML
jgi:hypothetical protein